MKRLIIAAVGLALVVGVVVGSIVGNVFGASAQRTSAAAVTGSGCYTNWNDDTCAPGFSAVSTGNWTMIAANGGGAVICAAGKPEDFGTIMRGYSTIDADEDAHLVDQELCATCCATGSPSAVGGIAELPPLASAPGGSGIGGATYAVLAGAAAGVLATLSVKRRGVK